MFRPSGSVLPVLSDNDSEYSGTITSFDSCSSLPAPSEELATPSEELAVSVLTDTETTAGHEVVSIDDVCPWMDLHTRSPSATTKFTRAGLEVFEEDPDAEEALAAEEERLKKELQQRRDWERMANRLPETYCETCTPLLSLWKTGVVLSLIHI